MSEKYVQANGIRLAYDEFGQQSDPAIVLIMGLGTQMIAWPEAFCLALARRGFRVIRFDNRDIGLSDKMEKAGMPNIMKLVLLSRLRLPFSVPYTLKDMSDDTVGLMDVLGINKAHIVGASMGGMIAQIVAARYPDRVLSLTSIMSSSGNPKYRIPKPDVMAAMAKRAGGIDPPSVESTMAFWRLIESPAYPMSDEQLRHRILASAARNVHPQGYARHTAAIIHSGSRMKLLKKITVPTLVIHGKSDRLVPVEAGIDTARHIHGARLELIEGMGHDLPQELLPLFVDLIVQHALDVAS